MDFNFTEQISKKTDSELVDIYTNYSDYQPEFVEIAQQEIIKRKIPLDAVNKIKTTKESMDSKSLAIGKQGNPIYLGLLGVSAIFGGILAIIGGYIYAYSKHTDANGNKYHVYNSSTRKWGEIIFFVGIGALLIFLYLKMV